MTQVQDTNDERAGLLEFALELAGVAVCALGPDGCVQFASGNFCALSGYALDELVGQQWLMLVPETQHSAADRLRAQFFDPKHGRIDTAEHPAGIERDWQLQTKAGPILAVALSARVSQARRAGCLVLTYRASLREATTQEVRPQTELEGWQARYREQIETSSAAAEALRESEARYRYVIDNATEGLLVVQDGKVVFANPRTERLVGRKLAELRTLAFTDSIHADDRGLVMDHHLRRIRGEPVEQHYAFRICHVDGGIVWVELSAVMIEWEGRSATLSFITDITERKRLEDTLKQSLLERETILESSIVGIALLNPQGHMQWANRALTQIFQQESVPAEPGGGYEIAALFASHEDYLKVSTEAARAVGDGRVFESELRLRRAHGDLFWAFISGRAVSPGSMAQGMVWVVMDITTRKQLEAELQRKTSEQEAFLQSTVVGIMLSVNRVHQWVNKTFAELVGYRPEELIGISTEVHFPDRAAWEALGEAAYEPLRRGEAYSTERQMRRRDGSLLWAQIHGKALDPERMDGAIWTFVDITERKHAETELKAALEQQRELNELKSRFVSMTSHEFRTPLATILSSSELIKHYSHRMPDSERTALLGTIEVAVHGMTKMLDDVLLIGKAEAQRLECNPRPVDLSRFCATLVREARMLSNSLQRASGEITFTSTGNCGLVMLDEGLLHQMLGNLLSNAVKYSPQGGVIEFKLDCMDDALEFSVSDTGIGMSSEDLPRVFETFYRASNVGNISGTGLGLAIVKRSAELHRGQVTVHSTLGVGTRFVVRLPRSNASCEGQA